MPVYPIPWPSVGSKAYRNDSTLLLPPVKHRHFTANRFDNIFLVFQRTSGPSSMGDDKGSPCRKMLLLRMPRERQQQWVFYVYYSRIRANIRSPSSSFSLTKRLPFVIPRPFQSPDDHETDLIQGPKSTFSTPPDIGKSTSCKSRLVRGEKKFHLEGMGKSYF